jgi:hypothetical protein
MMRAILIILLVVGVVAGGLLTLRSSSNVGMPDADVLERAKKRARELDDAEKKSGRD